MRKGRRVYNGPKTLTRFIAYAHSVRKPLGHHPRTVERVVVLEMHEHAIVTSAIDGDVEPVWRITDKRIKRIVQVVGEIPALSVLTGNKKSAYRARCEATLIALQRKATNIADSLNKAKGDVNDSPGTQEEV